MNRSVGVLRPVIQRLSESVSNVQLYKPVPECFVRYRKRRWSPITPSKLFVMKERHQQDTEEYEQLKTLYQRYRTAMKALGFVMYMNVCRVYVRSELSAKEAELHDKSHIEEEKQHHVWCLQENISFNELSANHRDKRQLAEQREKDEKELSKLERLENKRREIKNQALGQVLETKRAAESFITEKDLLAAIEATLNKRAVFNFAIDLEGKRYIEQTDGSTVVVDNNCSQ